MIILILSIIFLIMAPFLYLGALKFKRTWNAIERAMMILVGSLVTFHLLPESIAVGGDATVVIAFFGLFLPSLLEKLWLRYASKIHLLTVLVGIAGLFIHGMLDGAAIAAPRMTMDQTTHAQWLGIAVLLHRIPAGMLMCGMFHRSKGWGFVVLLLGILAFATVVGFLGGNFLLHGATSLKVFAYFQALVAGSLLHVALDQHEDEKPFEGENASHGHHHHH